MAFPLTVIVIISMIKDIYEDYKRHVADKAENERKVSAFSENLFKETEWSSLRVG
jgi:phospholipid-transporting ATPase